MDEVKKMPKLVFYWLISGCVLVYIMVVVGGITRLTGSGLSITQWKIVTGVFPPVSEKQWQDEFDLYKKTPQYKLINSDFSVYDFKKIYFWEYIHRLIGRLIGLVFIAGFLFFHFTKKFEKKFYKKLYILLFLGAMQGVLGWYMVMSGLSENIYVSHFRLAAHLISAFTVFGYTLWYALSISSGEIDAEKSRNSSLGIKNKTQNLYLFSIITFIILILQIIYGAFVAGLKAGGEYPTFPTMLGEWIPSDMLSETSFKKMILYNHAGVQFVHRGLAYIVTILISALYFYASKFELDPQQQKLKSSLLGMVLFQLLLGILTVLSVVSTPMAILHQTGAFILFSLMLMWIFYLRRNK